MMMRLLRPAVFLLGFAAMIYIVNAIYFVRNDHRLPNSIAAKFDYFALHKDEFDTIFIGASHIAMQIDPHEFDAETKRLGVATDSFNFGINGLTLYEVDLLLREIMALEPARLKTCVIDAVGWGNAIVPDAPNAYNARSVWWHTPGNAALILRSIFNRELSWLEKGALARIHLGHFFYRTTVFGSGVSGRVGGAERKASGQGDLDVNLGFSPILFSRTKVMRDLMATDGPNALQYRRQEDLVAAYIEDDLEDRMSGEILACDVAPGNRENFAKFERGAYEHLSRTANELGLKPIYLIAPRLYLYDRYKPEPALDFSDPKKNGQYFSIFNRNDDAHLTPEAAGWYSADIGRQYAEMIMKNESSAEKSPAQEEN